MTRCVWRIPAMKSLSLSELSGLSEIDREALERCIEAVRRGGPDGAAEVAEKLATEGWRQTAEWACWLCQDRALKCQPWQWKTPGRIADVQASLKVADDPSGE